MALKRKRRKEELTEYAPVGTVNAVSDSGWIDSDLFMQYMTNFAKHAKPTKESRVLLILDGHKSHTKNIEVIDFARENGIELLSLPPHTSHKLQPLDRTFFKPLKVAFNTACTAWMRQHPTRRITVDKLGGLFNKAYLKAATMDSAVSGFRCTGIVPFEPSILPDSEYLLDPRQTDFTVEPSISTPILNASSTSTTEPGTTSLSNKSDTESINVPGPSVTSTSAVDKIITSSPNTSNISISLPGPSQTNVTFNDIQKVPNIVEKKKSKRSEESQIITASPYKNKLLESISNKKLNNNKKQSKTKQRGKKIKPATKTKVPKLIDGDCECMICGEWWHDSLPGENWVQCSKRSLWLHELCCSSLNTFDLVCDICDT